MPKALTAKSTVQHVGNSDITGLSRCNWATFPLAYCMRLGGTKNLHTRLGHNRRPAANEPLSLL